MSKVFISYARTNKAVMERFKSAFEKSGVSVWTDDQISRKSKVWQQEIERFIDSCSALMVLMSPSAKKSVWVRREIVYAEAQNKSIYPVLVEGDKASSVPISLIAALYTNIVGLSDVKWKNEVRSLITEIKNG